MKKKLMKHKSFIKTLSVINKHDASLIKLSESTDFKTRLKNIVT